MMMPPQKAVKLDQAEKKMVGFPNDPTAMFPFFPGKSEYPLKCF